MYAGVQFCLAYKLRKKIFKENLKKCNANKKKNLHNQLNV